jgi:hypothetical protein
MRDSFNYHFDQAMSFIKIQFCVVKAHCTQSKVDSDRKKLNKLYVEELTRIAKACQSDTDCAGGHTDTHNVQFIFEIIEDGLLEKNHPTGLLRELVCGTIGFLLLKESLDSPLKKELEIKLSLIQAANRRDRIKPKAYTSLS